jgi:hypothetical protein
MTPLHDDQKQLLFDYCLGLTPEDESTKAEALISSNEEAAEIHSRLKSVLSPLNSLKPESCPDALAESTVSRLSSAAGSGQVKLQELLVSEQTRQVPTKNRFWPEFSKRLATAAVFMIVGTIVITVFNVLNSYARQRAWQQQCMMNLSQVFDGLTQYASDHDGKFPVVASVPGSPYWKVGYQGKENHSNTRPLWLLVKLKYASSDVFVCPGAPGGEAVSLDYGEIRRCCDFPSRKHISYSYRIMCGRAVEGKFVCRKVLMADSNPLFEKLPDDYSKSLTVRLTKDLLSLNSINHRRRGQNVLFEDGGAEFVRTRHIGILGDDIYTVRDRKVYDGTELPSCATDAFLAP